MPISGSLENFEYSDQYTNQLIAWRREQVVRIEDLAKTKKGLVRLERERAEIRDEYKGLDLSTEEGALEAVARLDPEAHIWLIGIINQALGE